jgi:hypothetical protein
VRLDRGRIALGGALVYLERTPLPPEPLPPGRVPRSHGLAPLAATGPDLVTAAVGPGEAVWLGFEPLDRSRPATLRVSGGAPEPVAAELRCPPDHLLAQLFDRGELTIATDDDRVTVRLVDPDQYRAATGLTPEPLDPDSAYTGWRAP